MGDSSPPKPSTVPGATVPPPATKSSGTHPAVREYRRKLESVAEHTFPELDAAFEELDRFLRSLDEPLPPKDPP